MKQLLVLFFCGLPFVAFPQTSATPARGTNINADAPVNVPVTSLRPAQPAQHSSVPVQSPARFFVNDDKPVTSAGDPVPAANPAIDNLPKAEWHVKKAEAAKAKNMPVPTQKTDQLKSKAGQEREKKPALKGKIKSEIKSNQATAQPAAAK